MNGKQIKCARCDGLGVVQARTVMDPWPVECNDCNGSGRNWLYPSGTVAKHYAGPLIGKAEPPALRTEQDQSHD